MVSRCSPTVGFDASKRAGGNTNCATNLVFASAIERNEKLCFLEAFLHTALEAWWIFFLKGGHDVNGKLGQRGRPSQTSQRAAKDWGESIRTKSSNLPSRLILHGVEGVGKTSFAAHAPKPIFLMARGETGLDTLIGAQRLSEVPHFPEITGWNELLSAVEWLTTDTEHEYKTIVLDTLNGFERLCHEFVCARDFAGDWGERGFMGYMRGYETSLADWRELLNALDRLREERQMAIIALTHTKVGTFKNPEGADYDRYSPDMHHKTWSLTHKWSDHVLFANFYTEVVTDSDKSKRGKAVGGRHRLMYTERHAAYDAKNRAGLPEEIEMGTSGRDAWTNFLTAMTQAKKGGAS